MRAGSACRNVTDVRSLEIQQDAKLARGHICDYLWNKEGGDPTVPFCKKFKVDFLNFRQSTHSSTNIHAHSFWSNLVSNQVQTRVGIGFQACSQAKVNKATDTA